MANIEKLNVDELVDATGGKDDATADSEKELDSADIIIKKHGPIFSYPALSLLVKLVDQYYRKKNS